MNLRPWHDETTLPLPLLGVQHQHQFAQTEAAVYVPEEAAQACTELGAEPPRVVDTLRRRRAINAWLAITLAAVVCAISLVGYFRVPA
jgi:hypothetical protein